MKLINIYNSILLEALKPSEFRRLYSIKRKTALKRIGTIWGKLKSQSYQSNRNGDRLYFQLEGESETQENPVEQEVSNYLSSNGFEVVDFKGNLGKKKGDKNQMKIGKILTMLGKKDKEAIDLLNKMNTSTSRAGVKSSQVIVISKSPYDIGGASTDRGWSSCMNLRGGSNKHYIDFDIKQGTLVSYLIKSDDLNIKNPMARVFIKPYILVDGKDFVYGVENKDVKYGSAPKNYMDTLLKMLDKAQGEKTGRFKIDSKLYPDGSKEIAIIDKNATVEEKLKAYGIENYTFNSDGSIDVDGDVDISGKNLTEIPFKFGKVTGIFYCSDNRLKSLAGAPESVGGSFYCSSNQLKSLAGAPKSVGGSFYCSSNQLKSLAGAPESVGGIFYCDYNELESLAGAPKSVGGSFHCSDNQLKSLAGAPKSVGRDFNCKNNQLKSLQGAPKSVGDSFYCSYNQLKSLAGAPESVGGSFYCIRNELESLAGAPKSVGGSFSCILNQLKSLQGAPKSVGDSFYCSDNQLKSLAGAPESVGRSFGCEYNTVQFTEEDVKAVCEVGGEIKV